MTSSIQRWPGVSMPRRALVFALTSMLGAGFLVLAGYRLDLEALLEALWSAELVPWLPLGLASYLAGHLVRGWRCRRLVSAEARLSVPEATRVVVVGYAINNLLPVRMGELARAGVLTERTGLPILQSLTVTFVERLLDGLTLLGLFWLTATVLPHQGWLAHGVAAAGWILLAAAATVAFAVLQPDAFERLASWSARLLGRRGHERARELAAQASRGLSSLRRPAEAFRIVASSAAVWALEAGLYLALLPAFGLPPDPTWALLAMTVTNLGILISVSPGYIGPFHFLCMQSLVVLGVPGAVALSYATVVHLTFFLPITALGVGVLWWYGVTLGQTLELARSARGLAADAAELDQPWETLGASSRPEPEDRASLFLRALAEAAVGAGELPETDEDGAVERTAAFLDGQLANLPPRLRLLFGVGAWGFRCCVAVRYLRGFTALPPRRRRQIFDAWAYGRFGPARQLFRPVRSISLLGWYEDARRRAPGRSRAGSSTPSAA